MGFHKIKILLLIAIAFSYAGAVFASMSCSVTTSCASPGVVVFRMGSLSNAHAELPSENNYSQLVCCTGVAGLANSCSGTYGTVLRLSGLSNAHVEENTESTAAYNGNDACLSVPSGTVTIGYQNNNCTGFDTTVASITQTPTNAHAGDASAYTRKICATVVVPSTINPCGNISCSTGNGLNNVIPSKTQEEILRIADFNNDGRIDILDLSILLYHIDRVEDAYSIYDLNKDGRVNFIDVSILFYYWTSF